MSTTDEFCNRDVDEGLRELQTDPSTGLSSQEAARRLEQYGYNEIVDKEEPLWHRIFRRFWGPISWMIEMAAILSALVQKWEDCIIILIMLLVNGLLDFFLLFLLLVQWQFSNEMIQSLIFAKLVIAGHGTIYNTRIDDWFWKRPYPSWPLFLATFSTRVVGTLIAVYGIFVSRHRHPAFARSHQPA